MTLIHSIALAAAETSETVNPFVPAGIALAVLLFLGIATWSYRDVANRQGNKSAADSHDGHGAGH